MTVIMVLSGCIGRSLKRHGLVVIRRQRELAFATTNYREFYERNKSRWILERSGIRFFKIRTLSVVHHRTIVLAHKRCRTNVSESYWSVHRSLNIFPTQLTLTSGTNDICTVHASQASRRNNASHIDIGTCVTLESTLES